MRGNIRIRLAARERRDMKGYKKLKAIAEEQYRRDIAKAAIERDSKLKAIEFIRELSNENRRENKLQAKE